MERITLDDPSPIERRKPLVVTVEVRNVYGNELIYPINEPAKIFASLTGNKTLNLADIQRIQQLGFEVAEIHKRKLPL